MSISRRAWLGYGLGTATAGAAGAAAVFTTINAEAEDGPAYQCWRQKDKGALGDLAYLARCGSLAPSAHNTQPWKFRLAGDRIELHADRARHLASADAQRRMMQLSIGCALENIAVGAQRLGYRAELLEADADRRFAADGHCATLRLHAAAPTQHPWFDAIFERRTHRGVFEASAATAGFTTALSHAAQDLPGIGVHWFEGPAVQPLEEIVRLAVRGFLTEARHRDGMAWFRITREEWERKRDGIAIFTSDAPFYAKRYVEWFATERELLSEPFRQGEIDAVDRVLPATPLWGLVHADRRSPAQRVQAGRLAERVYLQATAQQLAVQPLSYPIEVDAQATRLRELAGLPAGAEPLFLFRVGKARPAGRSVRRELADLLLV